MFIYRGKLDFSDYAVNEGITIMFPAQFRLGDLVYALWQWTKTSDGRTKVAAFYNNVIDQTTVIPTGISALHFSSGDYYDFDASFTNGITQLALTISGENGESGTGTLLLVDQPDAQQLSPFASTPRLYIGKLTNYAPYLVDETLLIVAPESMDEGNKICAFFQWTQTDDGSTNINISDVTTLSNVTWIDESGESFIFYDGPNNYYTYNVTVDEMGGCLNYTMTDPKGGGTGQLTLYLRDLTLSTSSRQKRSIVSHTTEVINDSQEMIVASLANSGEAVVDKLLAAAGMAVGQVGLVASLGLLPAAVGLWIAVIGWAVAIGGTVQVFNSSGEEISTTLFPGESMKRKSTGLSFTSNNDLHILLYRIDSGVLSIKTTKIEKTGDKVIALKSILPGASGAPDYQDLLPIVMPSSSNMSLRPYRIIAINGYKVSRDAKDLTTMKEDDLMNAFACQDMSASQPKWFGTMDDYYNTVINANDDGTMFTVDALYSLTLTLGIGQTGGTYASIEEIDRGENQSTLRVLKLTNCTFEDGGRSLYKCSSEDDIGDTIKKNLTYKIFKFTANDSWLVGMSPTDRATVYYSKTAGNSVYFVPDSIRPMQSLYDSSSSG